MADEVAVASLSEGGRSRGLRRAPRWPDGRVFNPMEDRMTRLVSRVVLVSLMLWVWALGRSDGLNVAVEGSWWILVGLLLAVSVLAFYGGRRRVWALAGRSGLRAPSEVPDGRPLAAWYRTPRWPDGRLFAVSDPGVTVASVAFFLAMSAVLWLCGEARIPRIEIAAYQEPLLLLLQLATVILLWVVLIRTRIVHAVVEGWVDDDCAELDFLQRRVVALAVDAKRARARFSQLPTPPVGGLRGN